MIPLLITKPSQTQDKLVFKKKMCLLKDTVESERLSLGGQVCLNVSNWGGLSMATKYPRFGIDLGTTNSSIGVWSASGFEVFQNRDRMNATPSAVYSRTRDQ